MSRVGSSAFAVVVLSLFGAKGTAAPITTVDQQNLAPFRPGYTSGGAMFGQSFIPDLPRIDAIEFLMADNYDTVVVDILDGVVGFDGLRGSIIGTSEPVTLNEINPFTHTTVHFDFAGGIVLIPGRTYVARLSAIRGSIAPRIIGVSITDDLYPRGQFLTGGYAPDFFPPYDMVFREGLTTPIPEPATVWLIELSVMFLFTYTKISRIER